jgi:hypothetical protein
MHPIQNRWVEIVYLIDGEELDALKIIEFPKEYGNKAIPIEWRPRFTTKTSASSNKKGAFHLFAISKMRETRFSNSAASRLSSPAET